MINYCINLKNIFSSIVLMTSLSLPFAIVDVFTKYHKICNTYINQTVQMQWGKLLKIAGLQNKDIKKQMQIAVPVKSCQAVYIYLKHFFLIILKCLSYCLLLLY